MGRVALGGQPEKQKGMYAEWQFEVTTLPVQHNPSQRREKKNLRILLK